MTPDTFEPRALTLFTAQWADMPLAEICALARRMGYDGLELACSGDHFDVARVLENPAHAQEIWATLRTHDLKCHAISNHLVGQAVCDLVDERHRAILPPQVWGDGEPEGVRQRAAQRMIDTATAARIFFDRGPAEATPVPVVNGFTGSSIWHALYAFPPTSQAFIQRGFDDFARRWRPILDAFATANVNFALEVHPTEIAFDTVTAHRALEAIDNHPRFGFNYDPSHLAYQGVDYVKFLRSFPGRIYHVHIKDVWWGHGDGTAGVFGGHTDFGDARRYWDFRSPGRGDIRFEDIIVALNDIGYAGPLSVEWEDSRMDRVQGASEAAAFVRRLDFRPSRIAFDRAFARAGSRDGSDA